METHDTLSTPLVTNGRLEGRVAVVTGAARGIGRAIAERLSQEGACVACIDVSRDRLDRAVAEMQEHGGKFRAYSVGRCRQPPLNLRGAARGQ